MFAFIRDFCVRLWVAFFWPTRSRTVVLPKGEVQIAALIAKVLNGMPEYLLPDKARVDILTQTEAIEVDWAHKWAEGIGQALYYGAMTKRTPVVLLLMSAADEERYLARVRAVIDTHARTRLTLWLFDMHTGQLDMGKKGVIRVL